MIFPSMTYHGIITGPIINNETMGMDRNSTKGWMSGIGENRGMNRNSTKCWISSSSWWNELYANSHWAHSHSKNINRAHEKAEAKNLNSWYTDSTIDNSRAKPEPLKAHETGKSFQRNLQENSNKKLTSWITQWNKSKPQNKKRH